MLYLLFMLILIISLKHFSENTNFLERLNKIPVIGIYLFKFATKLFNI